MTSTADTTQHPDVSEISDLAEGLLPPSRTADVRRHLDECALCAEVRVSLDEIRSLLGTLPAPQRMPDDIADRIDAALADEATHVSRETAPASQPTDLPDTPVADRPAGRSGAATGPGRAPAARRRRRRNAVLGAAFGAAVIGAGVFLLQSVNPSGSSGDSAAKMADDSFAAAGLEQKVHSLLVPDTESGADSSQPDKPTSPSLGIQSNTPKIAKSVLVPGCIEAGIGRDNALALQRGTYEGTKAYLVVLPHPSDPALVQAYVVDATCVDAGAPAKGKVLLTHSYARH
ncbi:anti-sigma factor family protein [Streptomyces beijiangensis]|uniref:Zinc-finger domain-containing protein n=1 Tax=Streptomyces beijiangensis TaxID=163361 RepID=A0A939F2D1_9ACTN|nr:hypothetical protein [Streptomyces beijiangensis]MBO0510940.1 hypothetical protein [Streptomyces beijiangensis]